MSSNTTPQSPVKRGACEAPQLKDLSLGPGVSTFRPGRTLHRSDFPPQPTVEQNEDESNLLDTLSIKVNDLRQRTSVLALSGEFENLIAQLDYGREV
jgi:hypothetical protein